MFFNFLKQYKVQLSLIFLSLIFFVLYLFLYISPSVLSLPKTGAAPAYLVLNQPDESINYFFIRQLALNEHNFYSDPFSGLALNQIHPRSTTIVNGRIVPIGFPGIIIIFGLILKFLVKIFGSDFFNLLAVSLTALVAAATPLFFYGFLRRIFNDKIAWVSSALLFFLPPWWYYASRPFQHNTLFVFFVILLFYFVSLENKRSWKSILSALLAGLSLGLAIYVRPSEVVWLSFIGLVGLIKAHKKMSWREYAAFASALVIAAILFFSTQIYFYGALLGSGYVKPDISGAAGSIISGPQGINIWQAIFLPFGFHPRAILHNFQSYFINFVGLWVLLAGWGTVLIINEKIRKVNQVAKIALEYFYLFSAVSFYILIFYGSWVFFDNLLLVPSIGTSYVRYFLPIYVFSLPLAAWYLLWVWQKKKLWRLAAVIILFLILVNGTFQVFNSLEGLTNIKKTVAGYYSWREKVLELTKPNDIILTHYADKYIFPLRQVMTGWERPEELQALGNLIRSGRKVWFFDLSLEGSFLEEKQAVLKKQGLKLGEVTSKWDNLEIRPIISL